MKIKNNKILVYRMNNNILLLAIIVMYFMCNNSIHKKMEAFGSLGNINEIAIRRHVRYDPYYFSYDMKDCYLATHHDGHVTRGFGNENWNSHRFVLENAGNGLQFIRNKEMGYYLYIDCVCFDVKSERPCPQSPLSDKHKWLIETDHLDRTVIRHPMSGNRFLALSAVDGNVYSRVDYANDVIFKIVVP